MGSGLAGFGEHFWRAYFRFLFFYASRMGNDFLILAIIAAGLVALPAIVLPMIFEFLASRKAMTNKD